MKEYRTIREVSGPLMVVDQVEGVTYDELGEIQLHDGTIRRFGVVRGDLQRYFVTVFMDTPRFDAFEAFLQSRPEVESASKIAGEGCYQVTLACESDAGLDDFTQALLRYGRYKVASEMRRVKP